MKIRKSIMGTLLLLGLLAAGAAVVAWRPEPEGAAGAGPEGVLLLEGHRCWVHAVAFAPDGRTVASAAGGVDGQGGEVKLWDVAAGRERAAVPLGRSSAQAVAFSPDGKLLAVLTYDSTLRLCDAATGKEVRVLGVDARGGHSVAFSADGKTVFAAGYRAGTGRAWDVATGAERQELPGAAPLALCPGGPLLAMTAADPRTVQLWDPTTSQLRGTLEGHAVGVTGVAISPDGTLVATADRSPEVRLWDARTQQLRAALPGHGGQVLSVAFSPDGRALATGGQDGAVRLWDVVTGRRKATLTGHEGPVEAVAFAPDGTRLASGGYDKTVRVWDLTTIQ